MTGLEIALFVLGAALIIISFFIVEGSGKASVKGTIDSEDAVNSFEELKNHFVDSANKEADFILHDCEDKLESLSNDKIMAVGEYSDQIVEKIEANHKEVVFLYQMLKEKEEELKLTVQQVDNMKAECEKLSLKLSEASLNAPTPGPTAIEAASLIYSQKQDAQAVVPAAFSKIKERSSATAARTTRQSATSDEKTETVKKRSVFSMPAKETDTPAISRNEEIIALYKSKKSVMEISKLLGMGQGEVKLIIDLYCK